MAPAGDMKWSRQAMIDSHYLTNICPQTHQLHGGRWA
ncbi:MAG: DNA/RNA non-specific endonuclease, partial [Muribaculaceae bacterium]|nr:DNA/RNA non-specific endonuclease [Muribaculaceae bacterium]